MSVVVAIKENDKIYMAADTMVTYGDSKRYLTTPHTQKIWAVKDLEHCIMGCVGILADLNLVRYCSEELIPELSVLKDDINIGTIINYTVPQIFGLITEYQKVCGKTEDTQVASSFLLGVKDHLFAIYSDGCVEEEEDFIAIGSGANMALASLENTVGEDVYVRLLKALSAAARISLYVDAPYVVLDNDTCKAELITYDDLCEAEDVEASETSQDSKEDKEKKENETK